MKDTILEKSAEPYHERIVGVLETNLLVAKVRVPCYTEFMKKGLVLFVLYFDTKSCFAKMPITLIAK